MTKRKTDDVAGTIHHLGNRGIDFADVFHSAEDYADYLNRMIECLKRADCDLLSFSQMPNHTHFLVRVGRDGGLAKLLRLVNAGYVKKYNSKYRRRGPLFEARFWDRLVAGDQYLSGAQLYIDSNSEVARVVDDSTDWYWSSASHYLIEPEHSFLTPSSWYLSLGATPQERQANYRKAMREYLRTRRPPRFRP